MSQRKTEYQIARKIHQLRKARGWTQADIASRIGRAQSRIAKWELSEGKPEPHDLLAFSNAFGVPLLYLCDDQMVDPREAEPTGKEEGTSQDETMLLGMIRKIGTDRAFDRLMGLKGKDDESNQAPPKR